MTIQTCAAVMVPPETLQQIDLFLEQFFAEGHPQQAGQRMLTDRLKQTQVRGLENLIVATTRFSEIINYIKNQTGKDRREWKAVGPLLLSQLEALEARAAELADGDAGRQLEIKLRLARGWARQVVAHYLYGQIIQGEAP